MYPHLHNRLRHGTQSEKFTGQRLRNPIVEHITKTFKTSHGIVVKSFRHGATGPWFESKTIVVLFFFQFNCDNYNLKPEELKIIKRDILIFLNLFIMTDMGNL
jgi:hypothetical protein